MSVIVYRELYRFSVQNKLTLVDTVSITADACSEVRRLADIILNRIEAEHYITHLSDSCTEVTWNVDIIGDTVESKNHVFHFSIFIRNHNGYDTASEIGYAYFHACCILQCVQLSLGSINLCLEIIRIQSR